jgi:hypothetical protein
MDESLPPTLRSRAAIALALALGLFELGALLRSRAAAAWRSRVATLRLR